MLKKKLHKKNWYKYFPATQNNASENYLATNRTFKLSFPCGALFIRATLSLTQFHSTTITYSVTYISRSKQVQLKVYGTKVRLLYITPFAGKTNGIDLRQWSRASIYLM